MDEIGPAEHCRLCKPIHCHRWVGNLNKEAIPSMKSLLFSMSALILVAGAAMYAADAPPAEGTKAPDFTLKSQEGKSVSLKDFKGKWVVLYFYPKDMTPGCTIEAHNFQRDQPEFDKKNAVIVGVSLDTVDSHVQFCTKENLTFKLLSDADHTVTTQYGSLSAFGQMTVAARNTFLIDPKGMIRKVYLKVDPNPHSKEVLAALDDLQKKSD
jgi:peroxiredoxin Q/BCP